MNQSNFRNLLVRLVIDKQLGDKLSFFYKQIILYKRDRIEILVALLKLSKLITIQFFKIFFQLVTLWCFLIFYNKINNSLLGQIELDLWQNWQFLRWLYWIVFLAETQQFRFFFIKFELFAEVIDKIILQCLIFCKKINYLAFKFLKIIFIQTQYLLLTWFRGFYEHLTW